MRRFGLIGRTLGHSFSARYFADKFQREGLADTHRYDLFELPEIECVKELIATTEGLVGFNVTIPYKQQIIPYLDSLSAEAGNIGAVNCVKIESDGRLTGYNTDIDGIRLSLDKLLGGVEIDAALVLGTGGASQAVQYVLAERNIPYSIVSRDRAKGNLTYDDLKVEVTSSHHLIINSSPVGMYPHVDQCPDIPYELLTADHYLFDLVYNPERTLFAVRAATMGAHTLCGLDMLYAQAESAWRIWNQ
ncbi:MAG: shikimate dehydrogenase [Rikenellaceae bacterium]|nr:shikimate dehydrogenase [Rikenellaceae bacterium]